MSASYPPLPDEIVELVHSGLSLLTGTCSNELVPECVRAVGVHVLPGACRVRVVLPKATSEVAVANLRQNGRLAVTMAQIPTHRTLQVKGTVIAIRDGESSDRELAEAYMTKLRAAFAYIGLPDGVMRGWTIWPLWSIDLEIEQVFAQTPGPVAGAKMPLEPANR